MKPAKNKEPNITCEEIIGTYTCIHCSKTMTTQRSLKRHINTRTCKILKDKDLLDKFSSILNQRDAERDQQLQDIIQEVKRLRLSKN
jgi:hypothetical protein